MRWMMLWGIVGMILIACGELPTSQSATNAPIIPPTRTHTPVPTSELAATRDPNVPTVDISIASWTPEPTQTPPPTRTLAPTRTPDPTVTPTPTIQLGVATVTDNQIQVIVDESIISETGQFDFERDGIWIDLVVVNTFLRAEAPIRASVGLGSDNAQIIIRLLDFENNGDFTVTRDEVETVLAMVAEELNQAIAQQANFSIITTLELQPDRLVVLGQTDD